MSLEIFSVNTEENSVGRAKSDIGIVGIDYEELAPIRIIHVYLTSGGEYVRL